MENYKAKTLLNCTFLCDKICELCAIHGDSSSVQLLINDACRVPTHPETPGVGEFRRYWKIGKFCWWSGKNSMYYQIMQLLL